MNMRKREIKDIPFAVFLSFSLELSVSMETWKKEKRG